MTACSIPATVCHLLFIRTLWSTFCYSHCREEKTEAKRGFITSIRPWQQNSDSNIYIWQPMFFRDASSNLPSSQLSANNPHGLNKYNLFSFNKSPSYQVNERQKTHIQRSMNEILEDFQKDKIWVIDHFSEKKKKMKKPFFVKQHFKHQLTLQD